MDLVVHKVLPSPPATSRHYSGELGGGGMEGDRGARGVRVLEGGSPQISARTPTPLSQPRCRPLH
eukprot:scaffold8182_cov120-Isochrysis_galbana.AAC.3